MEVINDLTITSDESFTELDTSFQTILTEINGQEILPKTTTTKHLEDTGSMKVILIKTKLYHSYNE